MVVLLFVRSELRRASAPSRLSSLMYMAVLHFTLPAASIERWRRSGLRIIQEFLELFCVFPGNLNFVRVSLLTCSLSKAAANIWPVRELAANHRAGRRSGSFQCNSFLFA